MHRTSTQSIEWHENFLRNQKNYYDRLKKELKRRIIELKKMNKDIEFYQLQIDKAKKK